MEEMLEPKELAARMGISPKRLRAVLRNKYPRPSERKGERWAISERLAREVEARYGTGRLTTQERRHYTVILEREGDSGYHAFCPALKGLHTQGDTLEESLDNVHEAIEAYLASLRKHGEPAPIEDILIKPVEVAV